MLDCVTKRIYVKWYACFCVVRNEHNRKKRIEDIALLVTYDSLFPHFRKRGRIKKCLISVDIKLSKF